MRIAKQKIEYGSAPGHDGFEAEMIKVLSVFGYGAIFHLLNYIKKEKNRGNLPIGSMKGKNYRDYGEKYLRQNSKSRLRNESEQTLENTQCRSRRG